MRWRWRKRLPADLGRPERAGHGSDLRANADGRACTIVVPVNATLTVDLPQLHGDKASGVHSQSKLHLKQLVVGRKAHDSTIRTAAGASEVGAEIQL